jgi:hypothetical protein
LCIEYRKRKDVYHNHEVVRGVVGVGTEYDLVGAGGGHRLRREPLEGQREQLQRVGDDEVVEHRRVLLPVQVEA